ncbi:hypothetical protein B0T10DRAFT_419907, partial [Thelonectria olida]
AYLIKITTKRVFKLGRFNNISQFNTFRLKELKRPQISNYFKREILKSRILIIKFIYNKRFIFLFTYLLLKD